MDLIMIIKMIRLSVSYFREHFLGVYEGRGISEFLDKKIVFM